MGAHKTTVEVERLRNASETLIRHFRQQIEQQKITFRDVAAAQAKAWREATDKIKDAAAKVGSFARADIDAAVKGPQPRDGTSSIAIRLGRIR